MFILKRKIFFQFLFSVFIGRDSHGSEPPGPSGPGRTGSMKSVDHRLDFRESPFEGFFNGCRYGVNLNQTDSFCSEAKIQDRFIFCVNFYFTTKCDMNSVALLAVMHFIFSMCRNFIPHTL